MYYVVLVAVGSGFVIFGTGCSRVRFPVVVGTIWLQYGPAGCSRDYFHPPPNKGLGLLPPPLLVAAVGGFGGEPFLAPVGVVGVGWDEET